MADTAFTWGAGGSRLTPEEIAQRRKDAAALTLQGTDASPLPVGTRGFGVATQGLARVAKALMGGLDAREADQAAKANAADNKTFFENYFGGGTQAAAASAPAATAASSAPAAPAASSAPAALDAETTGYINNAAKKFSVDPGYLSRTALIESGGKADATNPSGAAGLYQFKPATAKEYGLDNPLDPEDSAMAAAELAADNRKALTAKLGRTPTNAELYLAHQQGAAGAAKLLANPNAPAASLVGRDAVLQNGGSENMTAGEFAKKWTDKYGPDAPVPTAAGVQVASADPSFVPAAPAAPAARAVPAAPAASNPNVAKVTAALGLSPSTVQGAGYPSPLQTNTGPAIPLQGNIAGMPSVAPMTPQAPIRFAGQPGFVPPAQAAPQATAPQTAEDASIPPNATPTQGAVPPAVAKVASALTPVAAVSAPAPAPAPANVARVAGALGGGVDPRLIAAATSPYADAQTKQIAGLLLAQQMKPKAAAAYKDADGNLMQVGPDGSLHAVIQADKSPSSVKEFEYGQTHPDFVTQQLAKTKAGAAQLNNQNNIDLNSSQTYDKQLAEGLGKAHAGLANGVEDAQTRARDISAMQGAIDQIQKNGGTTGGLAPTTRLELQKSINAGAAALGIDKPFSEADISDKEFLTKFNRSMAGAQAKNAVGSRVTNFEMSNFLKANPGLDMTITGNQRLLGIQAQIEQRNIAVGNAIRQATAESISGGKKIDPVTVQRIITDYDAAHHVQDPMTGQDLTQSITLPEFQQGGTNAALAAQHNANMGPTEKIIGGKTYEKRPDGHWYEKSL